MASGRAERGCAVQHSFWVEEDHQGEEMYQQKKA
ncbi:hypothetical protein SEEN2572_02322 [Salmonella enterica subsp. enterica serovar Newport str. VA_R100512572]|nr:hypothetical protein SEEN2572_02322 [Salmonella enterica subsp. enterica serovar Newport str. VA_R100512572]